MAKRFDIHHRFWLMGGETSLPYIADVNLFAWDFTAPTLNGSKILRVNEMTRGAVSAWEQPIPASQPYAASTGASFPGDYSRSLSLSAGGGPALNASVGVYVAANILENAASVLHGHIMTFFGGSVPSSTQYGRLQFVDILSGVARQAIAQVNTTDNLAYETQSYSANGRPAGAWHTIEMLIDFATPSASKLWVNGAVAPSSVPAPATTAYPTTDSVGGAMGGGLYGGINACAVFDGVPSAAVRSSVSNWLNSVRPV